jgi:cell division protein ZapA
MSVLHFATATLKAESKAGTTDNEVAEKVFQLDQLLTEFFATK